MQGKTRTKNLQNANEKSQELIHYRIISCWIQKYVELFKNMLHNFRKMLYHEHISIRRKLYATNGKP